MYDGRDIFREEIKGLKILAKAKTQVAGRCRDLCIFDT
jgi:hypothetical protein